MTNDPSRAAKKAAGGRIVVKAGRASGTDPSGGAGAPTPRYPPRARSDPEPTTTATRTSAIGKNPRRAIIMGGLTTLEAARLLGGSMTGPSSMSCPGPGHGPRDRSLSVRFWPDAPERFVVHSHAGDDWQECRDYVRSRLNLQDCGRERDKQSKPRPRPRPEENDEAARVERALLIWEEARDPRGTVVEQYLAARGLQIDDEVAGGQSATTRACASRTARRRPWSPSSGTFAPTSRAGCTGPSCGRAGPS